MTLDASSVLPYGQLERTEVYFEHDGARFFALRSTTLGVQLLALCTDEDEESGTIEFLYLAMSVERFNEVRGGHVGLREAFGSAGPGQIWRVIEKHGKGDPEVRAKSIRFPDIPEIDLPALGARLNMPTRTAPRLDIRELQSMSGAGLRTVSALELEATGENLTEFPLKSLGMIGTRLQESLDSLAQEESGHPTERGAIPIGITDDVQMSVVGLRAASFAIILATDKRGGLLDNAPMVEATLGRLVDIVEAGHRPEELLQALGGYGPRARSKLVSLLRAVGQAGSGLGVLVTPQEHENRSARLSAHEVQKAVDFVDAVEPAESEISVRRGILLGSNTRTKAFDLMDAATGVRYSGKVTGDARAQIDGLRVGHESYVEADLLERIEFSATDQEGGRSYLMLNIMEQSVAGNPDRNDD